MEWLTDKRTGTQTGFLFIFGLIVLDIILLLVLTTQRVGAITFFTTLLLLGSIPRVRGL